MKNEAPELKNLEEQSHLPGFSDKAQARLDELQSRSASLKSMENIGKSIENVGKGVGSVVGGALGVVLGAIGASDSSKQGDIPGTVLGSISAGLDGIATITSAGEVAAFIAPDIAESLSGLVPEAISGILGATGGGANVIGDIVAVGALAGYGIYELVKLVQHADDVFSSEDSWYGEITQGFSQLGIKPPPELALVLPADGAPPLEVNGE